MNLVGIHRVKIAVLLTVPVIMAAASWISFSSMLQRNIPPQDTGDWSRPSLVQFDRLESSLEKLNASSDWGETAHTTQAFVPDGQNLSWQLIGIVNRDDDFAICWLADSSELVRLSVGDEIVAGVRITAIDRSAVTYKDEQGEHRMPLYGDSAQTMPDDQNPSTRDNM